MSCARFRVTLPDRYPPTSPGHRDPTARQGHYSAAKTSSLARLEVRQRLNLSVRECLEVEELRDP